MSEKIMSWLDYLAQYPPWVLITNVILIASAVVLFTVFSPSRTPKAQEIVTTAGARYAVWEPFLNGNCMIVVGTYYDEAIQRWEASGVIGTGNALALGRILGALRSLRAGDCDVVSSAGFSGDRLQRNLVLIGGPDANEVTRRVLQKLPTRLKFGDPDRHEIAISNSSDGKVYFPTRLPTGTIGEDFAVVIKAKNPFNEESSVIVVAGSFGHGTHAAAWLLDLEQLLSKVTGASDGQSFEALLRTEVVNDWPQAPSVLVSYRL